MEQEVLLNSIDRRPESSLFHRMLDYETYLKQRKLATNQKFILHYKNIQLALTKKQIEVLSLVAKGLSNMKIAKELNLKESTIKILIYRVVKYLEEILYERIDRYYLIIVAQGLDLDPIEDEK